eukprot:164394-Alexandrium_andersonii.AAC.1
MPAWRRERAPLTKPKEPKAFHSRPKDMPRQTRNTHTKREQPWAWFSVACRLAPGGVVLYSTTEHRAH